MNRLSNSTSPYLLQHAGNPVNWHPWDEEALAKAKAENKPIFLSIGYAACHWCHVMAHESFEDPETAALMNERFVNIKVDREERPDLDSIYMSATQAMTGSGGWPMSVFLTPDLQPFYAGTYFPPVRRYNMPSFREVLQALAGIWESEREKAIDSAQRITAHIRSNTTLSSYELSLEQDHLDLAVKNLLDSYDWGYGGWGDAPKFPQAMSIEFLLRRHIVGHSAARESAVHALRAMARGGIYDVVGGGFSRYSTDNFWRVPHFEKMLYDNALLARAYLHAWQITKEPEFKRGVEETLDFVAREMTHPDGGFYSSLDADSEGEEGKFYIWTREEIREQLLEDSDFFEAAYGITERGNWEGKTVLQRALDNSTLAARFNLDPETVATKLADCHAKLLAARAERVRPGTDDKVLTAWNGLMLATVAEAARVLEGTERGETYYTMATRSGEFLLTALRPDGRLRRSWRDGKATGEVFLEDYAALILGLLELYQTDFNNHWFASALELAEEMIERFSDPDGGFFDTPADGEKLVIRPKDLQDNATPSGNALACEALLKLAAFTENGSYRDLAENALKTVAEAAVRYPTAFARWLSAADFALGNVKQVAVLGEAQDKNFLELIQVLRSEYRPNVIVAASSYPPEKDAPSLLAERPLLNGNPSAYVCEGFVCKQPTIRAAELQAHLQMQKKE
ncbi:MAG: thioredoxin domain-containing protein [Anaerolineales bacterium]|nr:thioredoxin domain-containing protein [Anaerolineales bacterium]